MVSGPCSIPAPDFCNIACGRCLIAYYALGFFVLFYREFTLGMTFFLYNRVEGTVLFCFQRRIFEI